ncbi:DUF4382 domain-containing protein [Chloroflexota bacterium]
MLKAKLYSLLAIVGVLALLAGACAQPGPAPTPKPTPPPPPTPSGAVKVYVTDAPPRHEVTSILVTTSKLEIHKSVAEQEREQEQQQSSGDNQTQEQERERQQTQQGGDGWITIDISDNASTFDLLKIKGIEQFLGASQVEAGKYTQIRLIVDKVEVTLGDNVTREATVPSKELKLVHPFDVVAGETTSILLDFDAEKSVTVTGADKIIVKPVVKLAVRQGKSPDKEGTQKPKTETTEVASLEVPCNDFMATKHINKALEVNVADSFTVTLCSNPTTGFKWSESAEISDHSVLEQTKHKSVPPQGKGKSPAPGTAGQEIWTFKALEEGTSTISMDYSRPWEGGEKGEWTFVLTVTVK